MANLMLSVLGAVAQFERDLIRERRREGIALAKQRGAYTGRKKSLIPERVQELCIRVGNDETKAALVRVSDSELNATESPKLFATEKKSPDIIVLLLE